MTTVTAHQPFPRQLRTRSTASGAGAIVFGSSQIQDFDAFFQTHYAGIVRSLNAGFGASLGVEEAVQDAFVQAYARWRRIRNLEAPAAWVRRVAINRLLDHKRKEDRRSKAEQGAAEQMVLSAPPSSAPTALVDLIAQLAPRQRLAMALHYVEDLPVREIAASMDITEGAVKAHLSQGRANLANLANLADLANSSVVRSDGGARHGE